MTSPAPEILPYSSERDYTRHVCDLALDSRDKVSEALSSLKYSGIAYIKDIHELAQTTGVLLWNNYNDAVNPDHNSYGIYSQLTLLDNGELMLIRIQPGYKSIDIIQVDPNRLISADPHAKMGGSKLVEAIR